MVGDRSGLSIDRSLEKIEPAVDRIIRMKNYETPLK